MLVVMNGLVYIRRLVDYRLIVNYWYIHGHRLVDHVMNWSIVVARVRHITIVVFVAIGVSTVAVVADRVGGVIHVHRLAVVVAHAYATAVVALVVAVCVSVVAGSVVVFTVAVTCAHGATFAVVVVAFVVVMLWLVAMSRYMPRVGSLI